MEEKRQQVEQTPEPGASVAKIAQANGVNLNPFFLWRRQHRKYGPTMRDGSPTPWSLPATVMDAPVRSQSNAEPPPSPGLLRIELPKGRIWIEGRNDPASPRRVLEILAR
jgi:transposase-like protein